MRRCRKCAALHAGRNLQGTKQSCFVCRSLGVHCSKVRSLTLDSWEPELLKVQAAASKAKGSKAGQDASEANVSEALARLTLAKLTLAKP